jgi:hypothetical protein
VSLNSKDPFVKFQPSVSHEAMADPAPIDASLTAERLAAAVLSNPRRDSGDTELVSVTSIDSSAAGPGFLQPTAAASSVSSIKRWWRRSVPSTFSGAVDVLAQTAEVSSIRRPDVALKDMPREILYSNLLNDEITSYLRPSEVSALSRASRALYFHIDFRRNPFWLFCLQSQYALGLTSERAAAIFAAEAAKRRPQYAHLGNMGREYLRNELRIHEFSNDQIIQLCRLINQFQLSVPDAVRLIKLVSPVVSIDRISALLERGKTIEQIEKIAAVDLMKSAYASEAKWRGVHLVKVVVLFSLFTLLYSLEAQSNDDLDMALDDYDGNLPYTPNRLTGLIFTDFCDAMSDAYDVGNCRGVSCQEQQAFQYRWLAIWIATYGSLELTLLLARVNLSRYNSDPGFKLAVMQHFMLPEKMIKSV